MSSISLPYKQRVGSSNPSAPATAIFCVRQMLLTDNVLAYSSQVKTQGKI